MKKINQDIVDIKIHNKKYDQLVFDDPNNIFKPRVKILDQFQKKVSKFYGNILDIGAGSGYAAIWLALNSDAKKIICLENSSTAVQKLIPKNIDFYKVNNKVKVELGSFENIPYDDHFDFVISMGSIHHCSCLFSTMKSINKSLKNNGYLIMNEPSMANTTSNQEYLDKYNEEENFYGTVIKNKDRNDRFFREAEYISSAVYSGFDLKFQGIHKNEKLSFIGTKFNNLKFYFLQKKYFFIFKKIFFFPIR